MEVFKLIFLTFVQWLTIEEDEELHYSSTEYELLLEMMNYSTNSENTNNNNNSIEIVEYQPFWEFWVPGRTFRININK